MGDPGIGFSFQPEFAGELAAEQMPADFFARLQHRVEEGLFVPGRRARANYHVLSVTGDSIEFAAQGFLTAYNIGLNHVALRRTGRDTIAYQVRFDRWNRYALLHGGLLGLMLAGAYLLPATQRDLRRFPHGEWIFLGMTLFWSLAWPWLMTALHRPFASMALERILREELARDAGERAND